MGENKDAIWLDLTHLETAIIEERLPELRDLALTFQGRDMAKERIAIRATAHYSMGGIPTDIRCRVRATRHALSIGLYAAGECACVSVHGANRLGANSLLEAVLFGRIAGETIVRDLPTILLRHAFPRDGDRFRREVETLLKSGGKESAAALRNRLQESMTANAGIFRDKRSLETMRGVVAEIRAAFGALRLGDKSSAFNTELMEALELGHMIDYSALIVEGALAREESRGAHYRDDFPHRNDEQFLKHTFGTIDANGAVSLSYAPVTITRHQPQARTY